MNNIKEISPETFIKFCALMDGDPGKAVACLKPQAWPDFSVVSALARGMQDDLEPTDKNLARHALLETIAQWSERRVS